MIESRKYAVEGYTSNKPFALPRVIARGLTHSEAYRLAAEQRAKGYAADWVYDFGPTPVGYDPN